MYYTIILVIAPESRVDRFLQVPFGCGQDESAATERQRPRRRGLQRNGGLLPKDYQERRLFKIVPWNNSSYSHGSPQAVNHPSVPSVG